MELLPELAKKIIQQVQRVIREELIVVNTEALVIASTDAHRIGDYHEGAKGVIQTKEKLYITKEMVKTLKGVKAGINLPIFYDSDVIGVIGITGEPNLVEPFAEILRGMTELIIRESFLVEQKLWEMRGVEAYFYEWVQVNEINGEFKERGELLGISLDLPRVCLIIELSQEVVNENKRIQTDIMDWFEIQFRKKASDYLIRWGQKRFIILKTVENTVHFDYLEQELQSLQSRLTKTYGTCLSIGVSRTIFYDRIGPVFKETLKAVKVAQKRNKLVFYQDLMLETILEEVSSQTRKEFINKILGNLLLEQDLLDTLIIFIKNNQSIKQTAKDLHVHINTLHYRLKQLKELSGLDPKETEGAVLFYVALSLKQLLIN